MNNSDPLLYRFLISMRDEIDRHKWIESEKVGYDIGLQRAIVDWTLKYKLGWQREYMRMHYMSSSIFRR